MAWRPNSSRTHASGRSRSSRILRRIRPRPHVADGLPDAATLLKQCERRRLIAIGARRRRKQRKRLGLAIAVLLGAAQRKTFFAEHHGLLVVSEQS